MNLRTASDFEINKAVAESLGHKVRAYGGHVFLDGIDIGPNGVDYCNQWEDAGAIIQGSEIAILPPDGLTGGWMAAKEIHINCNCAIEGDAVAFNKNPLRAAMEVYLMMKIGES